MWIPVSEPSFLSVLRGSFSHLGLACVVSLWWPSLVINPKGPLKSDRPVLQLVPAAARIRLTRLTPHPQTARQTLPKQLETHLYPPVNQQGKIKHVLEQMDGILLF